MADRIFLGRYQAIRLLGEGGMGQVFLARQLDRDRLVAVKVLLPQLANKTHYREAFRREIDFMTRFRHPGAIELYEADMDDPQGPSAVMELVVGISLCELLARRGRLPPERVGRLLGCLCAVLQAAHDQGIIHRDLKPANIQVIEPETTRESVKVLDFGLARLSLAPSQGPYISLEKFTTASVHVAVGTPEYSCPEQFRGDDVDHRGDLYSLGIILYELLTGKRPFGGGSVGEVVHAQCHENPPPFAWTGIGNALSSAIEEVVMRCLAKDRAQRPQSARALALAFGEAIGLPIWDKSKPAEVVAPVVGSSARLPEEKNDPHVVVYRLQAWMPERIAAVKLRGFLADCGGEVVESMPGLIRVGMKRRSAAARKKTRSGFWALLGLAKKPEQQAEHVLLDVFMKAAADKAGHLEVTVRIRPAQGAPLGPDEAWRYWCDQILTALNGYLMAKRCG
jgi:serine/threonine-protein kinase